MSASASITASGSKRSTGQDVAQHQAAPSASVFSTSHRLAGHRSGTSPDKIGAACQACFHNPPHADDVQWQLQSATIRITQTTRRQAAHVVLHLVHASAGLMEITAEVEGQAFTDQHDREARVLSRGCPIFDDRTSAMTRSLTLLTARVGIGSSQPSRASAIADHRMTFLP